MPSWFDIAPRLGVSYDLFGNARTALKASFGKYMAGQTTSFPAALQPAAAPERHPDLARYERRQHRAGQRDRAEQQRRVRSAGADVPARSTDIKREYDLESTVAGSARAHPGPVGEPSGSSAAARTINV